MIKSLLLGAGATVASAVSAQTAFMSVFDCRSVETCDPAGGGCVEVAHRLLVALVEDTAGPRHFVAGPTLDRPDIGVGTLFEREVIRVDTSEADLADPGGTVYRRHAAPVGIGVSVLRDGAEVPGFDGPRALTRFDCQQELF